MGARTNSEKPAGKHFGRVPAEIVRKAVDAATKADPTPSERIPMPFAMPLSEDVSKKRNASREECIETLRSIALKNPTQVITRNYFRVNSHLAESAWNSLFGSFAEFKRQAGIVLTRQQHAIERDVAKHASVDHARRMSAEKASWGGKFILPCTKRFKTILVGSDQHDIECDPFWLHCFVETAKRAQPDVIVLLGDLFDLPEFGKYLVDPRSWDPVGRIKEAHRILRLIREAAPNATMYLIEGNHEHRLLRHLCDATPAMQVVLSDLHGMTVSKLLGLDEFGVNFIAKADLGVFREADVKREISQNFLIYDEALLFHHFPEGRRKHLAGCNGHHHSHQVWSDWSHHLGHYQWHQLGAGHRLHASYCDASKWNLGFALIHLDSHTKRSSWDYLDLGEGSHCVIGGEWYVRDQVIGLGNA